MNGSLNTTSFTERPPDPRGVMVDDGGYGRESYGYYDWYWHWGPFDNVEMRDDRTVLFASYMSPGTYVYEYFARATTPGRYMSLPAPRRVTLLPGRVRAQRRWRVYRAVKFSSKQSAQSKARLIGALLFVWPATDGLPMNRPTRAQLRIARSCW